MTGPEIILPPLPREWVGSYIGLKMQAFARQAIELDRENRAVPQECLACGVELGARCPKAAP